MFRRKILILFFFLPSLNPSVTNAQNLKPIIDSIDFSISFNTSIVSLNEKISDRKFWLGVLSHDTIFLSYLKTQLRVNKLDINILDIQGLGYKKMAYEFIVYWNPKERVGMTSTDSLPIPAIKRRPFHYSIFLSGVKDTPDAKILDIKYIGTEM